MLTAIPCNAALYKSYSGVKAVADVNGCTHMEGFAVGSGYLYTAKVNGSDTKATIAKINKSTGELFNLTYTPTGKTYVDFLGHANGMALASIGGNSNLYVATMKTGNHSLVRLTVSGRNFTKAGYYDIRYNGQQISVSGVNVLSNNGSTVSLIFNRGTSYYKGSIAANATSGVINVTKAFSINVAKCKVDGATIDASTYKRQDVGYYNGKIFVPLVKTDANGASTNQSIIVVYNNVNSASGTITNDPNLSFRVTSSTYSKFEIESCGISSSDGKLYFNTNRVEASTGKGTDAVHVFKDYKF
jgi:hypothetical protein